MLPVSDDLEHGDLGAGGHAGDADVVAALGADHARHLGAVPEVVVRAGVQRDLVLLVDDHRGVQVGVAGGDARVGHRDPRGRGGAQAPALGGEDVRALRGGERVGAPVGVGGRVVVQRPLVVEERIGGLVAERVGRALLLAEGVVGHVGLHRGHGRVGAEVLDLGRAGVEGLVGRVLDLDPGVGDVGHPGAVRGVGAGRVAHDHVRGLGGAGAGQHQQAREHGDPEGHHVIVRRLSPFGHRTWVQRRGLKSPCIGGECLWAPARLRLRLLCVQRLSTLSLRRHHMSTATATPAGTWTIDPSHSNVTFQVKHLGIATVRGEFTEFEGTLELGEDLATSKAYGTVKTASVTTNEPGRDEHLRSRRLLPRRGAPGALLRVHRDHARGRRGAGDHRRPDHPRHHPARDLPGRDHRHRGRPVGQRPRRASR